MEADSFIKASEAKARATNFKVLNTNNFLEETSNKIASKAALGLTELVVNSMAIPTIFKQQAELRQKISLFLREKGYSVSFTDRSVSDRFATDSDWTLVISWSS